MKAPSELSAANQRFPTALVPELTPVYLLKVTGSFMGISEKGIPLGI